MFVHQGMSLQKLDEQDLYLLTDLKQDSWLSTHRVTIANDIDQNRWFSCMDRDIHCPKNLVLVAGSPRGATDIPVGTTVGIFKILDIDYINRTAEVGWDIFGDYRGKGLGKKLVNAGSAFCFDILALRRLNAEILANNTASMKCAIHAGFVKEGCKREAVHRLGSYVDSVVYGSLASGRNLALQPKINVV